MKKKTVIIILAVVVLLHVLIAAFLPTPIVYGALFSRYDADAGETELPREKTEFASGKNVLTGYHYGAGDEKNGILVVIVPGFHAVQGDYSPVVGALLEEGFDVFTFDPTGCGESEGSDQIGFPQIREDIAACLECVGENRSFGCESVCLLGHSRGGYGVCCMLDDCEGISAAVSVGGINSAMEAVMSSPSNVLGKAGYLNYPGLWIWQAVLFGGGAVNDSAVSSINSSDTPVLIIQGADDGSVTTEVSSVYSHANELDESARVELIPGGHVDTLYTDEGVNADTIALIAEFFRKNAG